MKTIRLRYFSGTGNTEIVTFMIVSKLRELGCDVRAEKIGMEKDERRTPTTEYTAGTTIDCLGIGAPVIGFGTPSPVLDFIKRLPRGNGMKVFIFRTAGGVIPGNFNASRDMIALLEKKGYDVFHERLFSIGSNWIIRFSNAAMRKLHDATKVKTETMCVEIISGKRRLYETGGRKRFRDALLRRLSGIGLRLLALDFRVGKGCTGCGRCAKRCPAGNIGIRGGKPRFGAKCAACMRCVYACPEKAISMRTLGFLQVKGGYDVRGILEHPELFPDEGTNGNPPFMAGYASRVDA
jgi:ferredoxin/flavodoxin